MKNLLKIIAQKILGKNQSNLLDLCIVGLGNPGDKYNHSRHNAGYDYLDLICNQLSVELKKSNKIEGLLGETTYKDLKIGFVKPNEFINNSGRTLSLIKKYKVKELNDVLVIHDDMDLEPGEVKLKIGNDELKGKGEGVGPVNALDNALRNNFQSSGYSDLIKDLSLIDYKVRILNTGTDATTRVSIESSDRNKKSWFTIGVSENIIEASFRALIDSVEYKLMKEKAKSLN